MFDAPNTMEVSHEVLEPPRPEPTHTSAQSLTKGSSEEPNASGDPVVIAVMGATGTGKSTFINLVSESQLDVGEGLSSCTNTVQPGRPFNLGGRSVVLIDTPGFDDTDRSDIDVLNVIATFLVTLYRRGIKLSGILYFHRITDIKMGGTSRKNFRMFQKLCGESALENVVIVTNMWGGVDRRAGERREADLKGKEIFFKPALEKGARMARHLDTVDSAQRILHLILHNPPLPLRIQEEIADEGKDITKTSAGQELLREIREGIRRHQEERGILEEETLQAARDRNESLKRELEDELKGIQDEIQKAKNDSQRMAPDYDVKERVLNACIAEIETKGLELFIGRGIPPALFSVLTVAGAATFVGLVCPPVAVVAVVATAATAIVSKIWSWF